jgi:hypothetical protein
MGYDRVILNLSRMTSYHPFYPKVMKWRDSNKEESNTGMWLVMLGHR